MKMGNSYSITGNKSCTVTIYKNPTIIRCGNCEDSVKELQSAKLADAVSKKKHVKSRTKAIIRKAKKLFCQQNYNNYCNVPLSVQESTIQNEPGPIAIGNQNENLDFGHHSVTAIDVINAQDVRRPAVKDGKIDVQTISKNNVESGEICEMSERITGKTVELSKVTENTPLDYTSNFSGTLSTIRNNENNLFENASPSSLLSAERFCEKTICQEHQRKFSLPILEESEVSLLKLPDPNCTDENTSLKRFQDETGSSSTGSEGYALSNLSSGRIDMLTQDLDSNELIKEFNESSMTSFKTDITGKSDKNADSPESMINPRSFSLLAGPVNNVAFSSEGSAHECKEYEEKECKGKNPEQSSSSEMVPSHFGKTFENTDGSFFFDGNGVDGKSKYDKNFERSHEKCNSFKKESSKSQTQSTTEDAGNSLGQANPDIKLKVKEVEVKKNSDEIEVSYSAFSDSQKKKTSFLLGDIEKVDMKYDSLEKNRKLNMSVSTAPVGLWLEHSDVFGQGNENESEELYCYGSDKRHFGVSFVPDSIDKNVESTDVEIIDKKKTIGLNTSPRDSSSLTVSCLSESHKSTGKGYFECDSMCLKGVLVGGKEEPVDAASAEESYGSNKTIFPITRDIKQMVLHKKINCKERKKKKQTKDRKIKKTRKSKINCLSSLHSMTKKGNNSKKGTRAKLQLSFESNISGQKTLIKVGEQQPQSSIDSGLGSSADSEPWSSMFSKYDGLAELNWHFDGSKLKLSLHDKTLRRRYLKKRKFLAQALKSKAVNTTKRSLEKNLEKKGRNVVKSFVREIFFKQEVFALGSYFDRINNGQPPSQEERMQYEWFRVATFSNYSGNGNTLALARNGFYHDHTEGPTSTRCFLCDYRRSNWERYDDISVEHRRQFPSCPFHENSGQEPCNNGGASVQTDPASSSTTSAVSTSSTARAVNETVISLQRRYNGSASRDGGESIPQQPNEDPESRDYSLLALPGPCAQRPVGRAGHSYSTIIGPRRNTYTGTTGTRSNASEGLQQSNVQASASERAAGAPQTNPAPGAMGRTGPNFTVVVDNPKHPDYLSMDSRLGSYVDGLITWIRHPDRCQKPASYMSVLQTLPAASVVAEVCKTGNRAKGGDDPMLEHTRWFPRCEYVNKLKGERYVAAVQRRHLEHMAEQQRRQIELAQRRDENCYPPDPMTTDAAAVMREMGYSVERTREAILAVRHQTGSALVTAQQVLTWLLDDEERQQNGDSDLGVRPPPCAVSSTETSVVGTSIPSSIVFTGTSIASSIVYTGTSIGTSVINTSSSISTATSIVSAGTTTSTVSSTSTSTTAALQQSCTPASTTTEESSAGTENQQTSSVAGSESNSISNLAKGTSVEKQSGASGSDSDKPKSTTKEDALSTEPKSKTKKKKNAKKKAKNKARTKPETTEATGGDLDVKSLKAENEKMREMQTCKICMERPVNTTLLSCGHLVCCDNCAARLQRCPICRKRIKGTVKTFLS